MFARYSIVFAVAFILFISGCAAEQKTGQKSPDGIANPASEFCVGKGFSLQIREGSGGQVGYCVFPSGGECEEWAYFRGECVPVSQAKNGTPEIRKHAKEGEFCGGIAGIACEYGLECRLDGSYPDAGGLCIRKTARAEPVFVPCPKARGEICTMEYDPVCGRAGAAPSLYDYEDYPSPCVACSLSSPALSYVKGECMHFNLTQKARDPKTLYDCPSVRYPFCTNETDPVCGRVVDPTSSASVFQDYKNPCVACSVGTNAIAYYIGTCAGR